MDLGSASTRYASTGFPGTGYSSRTGYGSTGYGSTGYGSTGYNSTRYGSSDRSGFRVTGVVLLATVLVAVAAVVVPGTVGPGLGILAVGVGVALVLSGLNSPAVAVALLLVTLFFRQVLKVDQLPAEPFLFAFGGVLGAGTIAINRRVNDAPQFGPIEAAMALFILWCIGSAFAPHTYPEDDGNPAYYLIIASAVIPFGLFVVGRVAFTRDRAIRALLWTIVVLFGYSVLVSVAQFHAPGLVWPRYIVQLPPGDAWSKRAIGIFSNPVENGLMLVVGFLVALHLARQVGARLIERIPLYLVCLVSVYAIYLTHTRVVWLVFGMAMVIGAVALPHMRGICAGIVAVAGAVIAVNWAAVTSDDRAAGGVTSAHEIDDRLNMIATALWAIQRHPVVGWGIGRFVPVNTYHHQQWSQEIPWFRGYGIPSHLNELGIAAELGLIGLGLWLAVLFLLVRPLLRAIRVLPADGLAGRNLAVIGSIIFLAWFVTGLTVDLRYLPFVCVLVLFLAGVVVGAADRHSKVGALPPTETGGDGSAEDDDLESLWVPSR